MAGTRRKAGEQRKIRYKEWKNIIQGIKKPRDRAFISFLYLIGPRISEVVGKDGFKAGQITTRQYEGDTIYIFEDIICLKRRKDKIRRAVPIRETTLSKFFLDQILTYSAQKQPGTPLFPFTRQHAWRLIKRYTGMFPHFLRHMCASDLTSEFGYTPGDLKQHFGWSSLDPAQHYIHLNWRDLVRKQRL